MARPLSSPQFPFPVSPPPIPKSATNVGNGRSHPTPGPIPPPLSHGLLTFVSHLPLKAALVCWCVEVGQRDGVTQSPQTFHFHSPELGLLNLTDRVQSPSSHLGRRAAFTSCCGTPCSCPVCHQAHFRHGLDYLRQLSGEWLLYGISPSSIAPIHTFLPPKVV